MEIVREGMDMEHQNEEKWEQELIHRIDQIEENAKEIKTMTKWDYRIAAVITLLCLVVVVAGCAL